MFLRESTTTEVPGPDRLKLVHVVEKNTHRSSVKIAESTFVKKHKMLLEIEQAYNTKGNKFKKSENETFLLLCLSLKPLNF